jgi:hypothetical protein
MIFIPKARINSPTRQTTSGIGDPWHFPAIVPRILLVLSSGMSRGDRG